MLGRTLVYEIVDSLSEQREPGSPAFVLLAQKKRSDFGQNLESVPPMDGASGRHP